MKFSKLKEPTFKWATGVKGWVYSNKDDFPNSSGIYFEVTGRHGKVKTTCSDRVYFVISGKGEFVIDGKSQKVQKYDMVIVPKGTPYDYFAIESTVLKLFLVHTPAFDNEKEEKLD